MKNKIKKIGIICDPLDIDFKGISKYSEHLVANLVDIIQANHTDFEHFEFYFIHLKENETIKKYCLSNSRFKDIIVSVKHFPFAYELRKVISIPLEIRRLELDLVHELANAGGNMFFRNKAKQITTIHDITPITNREWHTFNNWLRNKLTLKYTLSHSSHIISVSQFTKDELEKRYKVNENQIEVIPLAAAVHDEMDPIMPRALKSSDNFILSVSTIEPRKNFTMLARAFSELKQDKVKLVIAGRWGWKNETLKQEYESGTFKNVIFLGEVTEQEKKWLYDNAYALCCPSLAEGFGMPIVEGANYSLPVICSNIPVFKEVAQGNALFFNPRDIDDIRKKLLEIINDGKQRLRLAKASQEIAKNYSWKITAQKTLKAYEKALLNG